MEEFTWESTPTSHTTFPKGYISCPLDPNNLRASYSLTSHSPQVVDGPSLYHDQEQAYIQSKTTRDLSRPITPHSKREASNQTLLSPQTIQSRVDATRAFIGFCVLHLHLDPMMELLMEPLYVAKYLGFHVAKRTSFSTINKMATHLKQMAKFVDSQACPKGTNITWSPYWSKQVLNWFSNLKTKALLEWKEHKEEPAIDTTLWSVWEHTLNKWNSFLEKFKVSANGWLVCLCVSIGMAHKSWFAHQCVVLALRAPSMQCACMQSHKEKWSTSLAKECQECVLAMLVVGLYQPPLRVGALRVLHSFQAMKECIKCTYEHCTK